jgi:hypothetical protein
MLIKLCNRTTCDFVQGVALLAEPSSLTPQIRSLNEQWVPIADTAKSCLLFTLTVQLPNQDVSGHTNCCPDTNFVSYCTHRKCA